MIPLLLLLGCAREPAPVALWFGGDVYLGEARPLLDEALGERLGAGIVNLEGPVGAGTGPDPAVVDGRVTLTHAPATLGALGEAGVIAASIANNHAGDVAAGGSATASALRERGVAAFGAEAGTAVVEQGGLGVVLASWYLDETVPEDLPAGLAAARAQGDRLVVAFHVDGPPDPRPSAVLVEAVDLAVGAGAHVVVAHGTHGFGAVERRGDAVVAWGLGNLAFDCRCTAARDAIVLVVDLRPERAMARAIPVAAGLWGAPAALSADPEAILDVLDALGSTPLRREADAAAVD